MKKIFKYLLVLVAIVLLAGIAGAAFISIRGIPAYEVKKINYQVEATPERLERGKKLTTLLCAGCHLDPATNKLTGEQMMDAPPEFGKIFSQNITQDKTFGIGTWTDGELLYLLRTGIKRDGKFAPPWMAKLPHMADEDINSIIAFLHSDDPLVTASATPDQPCEPSFLSKFLCVVAFKPLPMPETKIEMPDTNNAIAFGKYLVYNLECWTCHSADFKTMNSLEPDKTPGFMGGGNQPLNREGKVILTQNITADKATGIGEWSLERFTNAVKYGIMVDQPALRYPMMPYAQLTDAETKAIYEYLRSVPPIVNKVPRSDLN